MSREINFERLVTLCQQAHEETRSSAARAADRSLVVRNWLFGWYIVEYEQQGADRAEYGAQTLMTLSAALKSKIGRGFSVDALERMRRFYLLFDHVLSEAPAGEKSATPSRISGDSAIAETLSRISPLPAERISHTLITKLARHFPLGWSQYAVLLSLDDADARRFYEIEAADNGWSVRELKRHVKTDEELPTVGILLCDRKNDAVVELTLPEDTNIYASKYQIYLPSKQQFAAQIESVRQELEGGEGGSDE